MTMFSNGYLHGYLLGYMRKAAVDNQGQQLEPNPWNPTFSLQPQALPPVPAMPDKPAQTVVPDLKSISEGPGEITTGAKLGTKAKGPL